MLVLVLNCGSSSIKYQLIDTRRNLAKVKGIVAKIGEPASYIEFETQQLKIKEQIAIPNHAQGLEILLKLVLDPEYAIVRDVSEISAIGHRVVHGGDKFTSSALINAEVIEKIRECIPLAPLHNPHNLAGIEAATRLFPGIPQVAVFDTSFHQTLPEKAFLYPIPYEFYRKYNVRKYGFHGTSCRYVSRRAAEIIGRPLADLKIITCHLGNGVTVDAIEGGKSIDTSMGLTPVEGLMMGTRSGDVDPGVIYYISKVANLTLDQIYDMLNTRSGLLGISGVSNDMKEIAEQAERGNRRCKLAMEMFAYRVTKYIGSCTAVLKGVDVIVFTAGIGSNSPVIRSMICDGLGHLGVRLDSAKNQSAIGVESDLSEHSSRVKVLVIPTNEEMLIALDTQELVNSWKK
jgi:acetate kinase